jgi:hypothetical protein
MDTPPTSRAPRRVGADEQEHDVRATALAVAVLLAALTACGSEEPPPPGGQDVPGVAEDSPDADLDDGIPDIPVDQAVVEAGGEAGVEPEAIEVIVAEEVTWSDGSIGCPEPDGMYTQALVEGYRIVLDVAGEEVHYHGARGEPPFRCEDPQPPAEGGDAGTVDS